MSITTQTKEVSQTDAAVKRTRSVHSAVPTKKILRAHPHACVLVGMHIRAVRADSVISIARRSRTTTHRRIKMGCIGYVYPKA